MDADLAYRLYSSMLEQIAGDITGDKNSAQDIVNDTFLHLMKHYDWWQKIGEKAQKDYLIRTCIKLAKKSVSETVLQYGYLDEINYYTQNSADTGILNETLKDYVDRLSENEKKIIKMKYYESQNSVEIGKRCEISADNVLQRLYRARQKLKRMIDEEK